MLSSQNRTIYRGNESMRDCRDIINEEDTKQLQQCKQKHYYSMERDKYIKQTSRAHFTRKPYTVKGKKL